MGPAAVAAPIFGGPIAGGASLFGSITALKSSVVGAGFLASKVVKTGEIEKENPKNEDHNKWF